MNHENINTLVINLFDKIDGDRNCYYRNLSFYFTKTEYYFDFFRQILFQYIYNKKTN